MSSTSTRTFTEQRGNTLKTVTETTIKYADGRVETKREEKTETVGGGGNSCAAAGTTQQRLPMGNHDDMLKNFNSKSSAPISSSGGSSGASGKVSLTLKDFRKQSLDAHNSRRAKHGAAPLKLSDDLNDYAQKWADHLVKTGTFQHSNCMVNNERVGENIANKWSSGGADYTGEEAVQQWYSEISKHDYNRESVSGTGHFTQVVWKGSKELGMGKATDSKGACFVVGSYRPAGNMMGEIVKNVTPPK